MAQNGTSIYFVTGATISNDRGLLISGVKLFRDTGQVGRHVKR